MHGRHDRNAKIHVAAFVANPEATVLGHAAFGNVELGHYLDTRDQRLVVSEIYWVDLLVQRAVDAILHLHFRIARFDVDVGRARLHGVVDNGIDQLDDRRHLAVSSQPIKIEDFLALLSFTHQRNAKS